MNKYRFPAVSPKALSQLNVSYEDRRSLDHFLTISVLWAVGTPTGEKDCRDAVRGALIYPPHVQPGDGTLRLVADLSDHTRISGCGAFDFSMLEELASGDSLPSMLRGKYSLTPLRFSRLTEDEINRMRRSCEIVPVPKDYKPDWGDYYLEFSVSISDSLKAQLRLEADEDELIDLIDSAFPSEAYTYSIEAERDSLCRGRAGQFSYLFTFYRSSPEEAAAMPGRFGAVLEQHESVWRKWKLESEASTGTVGSLTWVQFSIRYEGGIS